MVSALDFFLLLALNLICSFSGFLSCRLKIDFEFSYLIYAVTAVNFPLDTGFTASKNFDLAENTFYFSLETSLTNTLFKSMLFTGYHCRFVFGLILNSFFFPSNMQHMLLPN